MTELDKSPGTITVAESRSPAPESWLREKDLQKFSRPHLVLMSIYGGLVGFVTSAFFLIYAEVFSDWFFVGVVVGTVSVAILGALRNYVITRAASLGFPTVFNLQRLSFWLYFGAVISGGIGVARPGQVLPFAALFVLLIYFYLLWRDTVVRLELGRLFIFEFLTERDRTGRGYSWLRRGLSVVGRKLQIFGVSVKRNRLYFGSSYSLFEDSDIETDLDKLYLLGDWSSDPKELNAVHDIISWFLSRTAVANVEGFSGTISLGDYILEILGTLVRNTAGAVVLGAAIVTIILGAMQLLQQLGLLH